MLQTPVAAASLDELEAKLGYEFHDRAWLLRALTHSSHRGGEDSGSALNNERLEFLGDAILGFVVSDRLCESFPGLSEGKLSRMRANLVSAQCLGRVAEQLELGRFLLLGPGEEKTGGRRKRALLSNAVEALVAAVYRDGGLNPARRFIETHILPEVDRQGSERLARADHKSALQEFLQAGRMPAARYSVAEERGPEHKKTFRVDLWMGDRRLTQGVGSSKKSAEQDAARQALTLLAKSATLGEE